MSKFSKHALFDVIHDIQTHKFAQKLIYLDALINENT